MEASVVAQVAEGGALGVPSTAPVDKPLHTRRHAADDRPVEITDLGLERRCNTCREWWPMDGEFFHRNPKGIGGFLGTCRACFAEKRQRRDLIRRGSGTETIALLRAIGLAA